MTPRLGAVDEAYLLMEGPTMPMHVASVGVFEGPGLCTDRGRLRLDTIRHRVEARLDLLPRLRERVVPVPFGLHRSVWVEDEHFDISNHVDSVALRGGHDEAALIRLVEELVMEPLPRDRPLWHLRFVTGLEGGRVALVQRAHHAMIDGISGVDVSLVLLDATPEGQEVHRSAWAPAPAPTELDLAVGAVVDRLRQPVRLTAGALTSLGHPIRTVSFARQTVRALDTLRRTGSAPATSLTGRLGPSRRLAFVRQRLESIRAVAAHHDATLNDVALDAVAGGLRELFVARGEPMPSDRIVNVLVPVSVRAPTESGALGNRVGALVTPLPVGIGDPVERLRTITATTRLLKSSGEATTADQMLQAADVLPPWLARRVVQAVNEQPLVSMVVTNVPGPDFPLYAMGSRMIEAFPVVPLGARMTLEVALLSYDGQLNFGVTADRDACPDSSVFVHGITHAFAELGASWRPALERL
jgi:WS/DGAT/MGAT family acyltransferase